MIFFLKQEKPGIQMCILALYKQYDTNKLAHYKIPK